MNMRGLLFNQAEEVALEEIPVVVITDAGDLRASKLVGFTFLGNFAPRVESTRLKITFWSALE